MPASLNHITDRTPMGANLIADGATFRVWAPNAKEVYVIGAFNNRERNDSSLLTQDEHGHWRGFIPGVKDRDRYNYYVVGEGSEGPKRDPYARELDTPFPGESVVREPDFPWHETGFSTPAFSDFVIYQLHVGTFYTPNLPNRAGTFLDVATKIPYLENLGITAIQLLPIQEFPTQFSLGYNGVDYFSPEMDFAVPQEELGNYLWEVNALLTDRGLQPYREADLIGEMNQLKALIDICHVYGIAVIFDLVFNHAGGDFGDESIYFFDRQTQEFGNSRSLYFLERGHAGGLVFDYGKPQVRSFLIDNALFFLEEYRVDGFRFDQVSVIDHDGAPHGWQFVQDLTATMEEYHPGKLQKAEYWGVNPYMVMRPPMGAGFDTSLTDGLRIRLREVVEGASWPDQRPLPMEALARSMWVEGFHLHWQFVQGPENHDIVYVGREERIVRLADPSDPRSWYARSRARAATGLTLTAPGIPMLFMGQEFLEDKQWSDNFEYHDGLLLDWEPVQRAEKEVTDHLLFISDLLELRKRLPALRGQGFRVISAYDPHRILAFHRWAPLAGADVVVVVHFSNFHRDDYRIGFPGGGEWREVFNSDYYENLPNPDTKGNGGRVIADDQPYHGYSHSAAITVPANGMVIFTR